MNTVMLLTCAVHKEGIRVKVLINLSKHNKKLTLPEGLKAVRSLLEYRVLYQIQFFPDLTS